MEEKKLLDPLKDVFKKDNSRKLDMNVERFLFECQTMQIMEVEKLKVDQSKILK